MSDIQIIEQNPKKMLEKLKLGEIERMELAVEQITDEFLTYGFLCFGYRVAGLVDELSNTFPDPRKECEITISILLN